jgi:hypothetical protein
MLQNSANGRLWGAVFVLSQARMFKVTDPGVRQTAIGRRTRRSHANATRLLSCGIEELAWHTLPVTRDTTAGTEHKTVVNIRTCLADTK